MQHCAIDLGGRKSQVCVRSEQGEIAGILFALWRDGTTYTVR